MREPKIGSIGTRSMCPECYGPEIKHTEVEDGSMTYECEEGHSWTKQPEPVVLSPPPVAQGDIVIATDTNTVCIVLLVDYKDERYGCWVLDCDHPASSHIQKRFITMWSYPDAHAERRAGIFKGGSALE